MLFAIDDSEIEIENRPHTILAAVGIQDPSALEAALNKLKVEFGLTPADEVKWNGMKPMPQIARESLSQELMILLNKSVPLVVFHEGRNKRAAADRMAVQIAEYMSGPHSTNDGDVVELIFDEEILCDETEYSQNLRSLAPSAVATARVTTVRSHESAAIQLADVLAGFNRLATEIVLGRANRNLSIEDEGLGTTVEMDLLSYISLSLRWAMWGEVPPPPDPDNIAFTATWPFKHVGGYGLRFHSTIAPETIEKIYRSRVVYMGCMH